MEDQNDLAHFLTPQSQWNEVKIGQEVGRMKDLRG